MNTSKRNKPAPAKNRIYLVDDHPVTREGLVRLINGEADLEVCGGADTTASAISGIEQLDPDLAIIDLMLDKGVSGLELIKDLAARDGGLRMLTLSMCDEALYAERTLRAGAQGYVMKEEPTDQLLVAIRTVLNGEVYLSKAMSSRLVKKLAQPHAAPVASEIEQLSDRELEVFGLLGRGLGTRQIAEELHLSISTVQTYYAHIKVKLNLPSVPQLMRHAIEWVRSKDF